MTSIGHDGQATLDDRIALETFIADRAARFVALPPEVIEHQIELTLRELLAVMRADRCALLGGEPGAELAWVISAATAEGADSPFREMRFADAFPWHFHHMCREETPVVVATLADLPVEADMDRQSAQALGVRSMLTVRGSGRHGDAHCLTVQWVRQARRCPEYYAVRLHVLVDVLVNALNRKREAETRRQLELSDGQFLESVGAILWRADPRTFQTTFVSKEAESILGYPVESWLKVPGFWRDHVHPDDRAWVEAFSGKATLEGRRHDFEYRMIVADGRTVWLRNIVNVIVEHGQPTELVGVTVDITARRHAELEAARLRHELTHAARVTSLGELAATLAHELNQPLGAIVSNAEAAQIMLSNVAPPLDQIGLILGDIIQAGQRAGAVLHRVRLLLQKRPAERRPLNLPQLVNDVVGLVRALAFSRQTELTVKIEPSLRTPTGDAVQIQQVLLNLIFNAMDAVVDRPVGMRHVLIGVSNKDGANVELSVSDSGTGISADALPKVLDPFFTTKEHGMGMGLAICRSIVKSHGGHILVESRANEGATIRITLPTDNGPDDRI